MLAIKAWAARAAAVVLIRTLGCTHEALTLTAGAARTPPSAELRRAWVAAAAVGEWTLRYEWPAPDARAAANECAKELRKLAADTSPLS